MNGGNYVDARLENRVLSLEIRSNGPDELRVGGANPLDDVFAHFGRGNISEFEAHWVPRKNWDTNYHEFIHNRDSMNDVAAAWETWTGRQMKKRDFENAEVVKEEADCITVRFY